MATGITSAIFSGVLTFATLIEARLQMTVSPDLNDVVTILPSSLSSARKVFSL